ncbi:Trichodiene synthase [Penicillium herquei]|nr:Trichodiene synthase [Penicillium herquei]
MGSFSSDPMKEEYTEIFQSFLHEIDFQIPNHEYHAALQSEMTFHFTEEGFSENFIRLLRPILEASAGIAMTTFYHTSLEVQKNVGIYTTYAIFIDDQAKELEHDLKQFSLNLLCGKPQKNKLLESYAQFLMGMHDLFGQFGGDMIIKDTIQFISACYLELKFETNNLSFPRDAPDFPNYIRIKTGVAEAYAFMVFPEHLFSEEKYLGSYLPIISYLQAYLNSANDIMSSYKEAFEEEDCNFVDNSAKMLGVTRIKALRKLCADTVELVGRLRCLSSTNSTLCVTIESFIHGYIMYHLCQRRYRLEELGLDVAIEAQCRVDFSAIK